MDRIVHMIMDHLVEVSLDEVERACLQGPLDLVISLGRDDAVSCVLDELEAFSSAYIETLGQDAFNALILALWQGFEDPFRQAVSSCWRQLMVKRGEDLAQIARRCDMEPVQLLRWCSSVSCEVPVVTLLNMVRPLSLMGYTYHILEGLSCWEEADWEAYHARVRACIEGVSVTSIRERVPLGKNSIDKIKRGLVPEERLYRDFFTLDMILDVYEEPQEEEDERERSAQTVSLPDRVGSRDPDDFVMSHLVRALEVLGEHVLQREDVMLMMSQKRLHLWAGDLYVTSGEGVPERPDPVI